jgi:hypothetical protein
VAVFDLLIHAGADLEAKDDKDETPLFRLFPITRAYSQVGILCREGSRCEYHCITA